MAGYVSKEQKKHINARLPYNKENNSANDRNQMNECTPTKKC